MVGQTTHTGEKDGRHFLRGRLGRAALLGVMGATLLLVACGDDNTPTPAATTTPVMVVVTATPGPTPTPVVIMVAGTPVVVTATPGPTATPVMVVVTATPQPTTIPAPTQPASKRGGTVIMVTEHPQATVPLIATNSVEEYTNSLIYNGLTRPDAITLDPTPELAESWETTADGLTWTFKLRPGITWSDGQPLTADDVKFSWEFYCHLDIPGNADACDQGFQFIEGADAFRTGNATEISGIEVTGDLTFSVKMTQIYSPFLNLTTQQFILPKHALESIPAADMGAHDYALGKGTIGTGPFIMEFWTQNESLGVRAREDYWEGRPNVDAFVIRWCLGAQRSTAFTQMKVGEINLMAFFCDLPHDFVPEVESDPALDFFAFQGVSGFVVEFNMNTPPFGDSRMRQALSYATNRDLIGQGLYSGRWLSHPYPTAPAFTRLYDPNMAVPDNDPAKLAELMGELGYTMGSGGLFRDSAGDTLNFELSHYPSAFQFGPALHAQWRAAGIDVAVQGYEWAAFFFPIYLEGLHGALAQDSSSGDYHALAPWLAYLSTASVNGWPNEQAYQDLIAGINSTLDVATQERNYKELQRLIVEDQYVMFAGMPDGLWGHSSKLVIPQSSVPKATMRYVKDFYFKN